MATPTANTKTHTDESNRNLTGILWPDIQGVSKQMRKTSGGDSLFKIKGSLLHKRWVKSQPLGRYRGTKMAEK